MIHEMVHAVLPKGVHHGPMFHHVLHKVNPNSPRHCTGVREAAAASRLMNWVGTCPGCGKKTVYARRPSTERSCGVCRPGVFDQQFVFVVKYEMNKDMIRKGDGE